MKLDTAPERKPAHLMLIFALWISVAHPLLSLSIRSSSPSFPVYSCFSSSIATCQQTWQGGKAQSRPPCPVSSQATSEILPCPEIQASGIWNVPSLGGKHCYDWYKIFLQRRLWSSWCPADVFWTSLNPDSWCWSHAIRHGPIISHGPHCFV